MADMQEFLDAARRAARLANKKAAEASVAAKSVHALLPSMIEFHDGAKESAVAAVKANTELKGLEARMREIQLSSWQMQEAADDALQLAQTTLGTITTTAADVADLHTQVSAELTQVADIAQGVADNQAQVATDAASATQAAGTASTKASEASASAADALTSKQAAQAALSSVQSAQTAAAASAASAQSNALSAASSSEAAASAVVSAAAQASIAETSANEAELASTQAYENATIAIAKAAEATAQAAAASTSAGYASTHANNAALRATAAAQSALDAQAAAASIGDGNTNLGAVITATKITITSDTGTDADIPLADAVNPGLLSPTEKAKLADISGTNTGDQDLSGLVPKTTKVNGHALSGDVELTKADVGLNLVENTADLDKPVSTATTQALGQKSDTGHGHNAIEIAQDATHRFVTDSEKSAWSAKQEALGFVPVNVSAIGQTVASLVNGQVPAAQIPSIALTEFLGLAGSEAAMLAKAGELGDWCVRSDRGTNWVITGADPTLVANWTELTYPAVPVQRVAGRVGDVVLDSNDLTDGTSFGRAVFTAVTAAAARAAIGAGTSSFSGSYTDLTDKPSLLTAGGGNKQIQINSSGSLAGDANFTWDSSAQLLTVLGSNASNTSAAIQVGGQNGDAYIGAYANMLTVYNSTKTAGARMGPDNISITAGGWIGFGGDSGLGPVQSGGQIGFKRFDTTTISIAYNEALSNVGNLRLNNLKQVVGGAHYLYNLDTDASNYERGFVRFAANEFQIGHEFLGTGALRTVGQTTFK